MFRVFTRNWYRENAAYPNGLEPHADPKTTIAMNLPTEDEARKFCKRHNEAFPPGRLGFKAEYEAQEQS
jgi:hypothetical protein